MSRSSAVLKALRVRAVLVPFRRPLSPASGASISGRSSWLIWKRTAELSDEGSALILLAFALAVLFEPLRRCFVAGLR
jgi:hypothetical protein